MEISKPWQRVLEIFFFCMALCIGVMTCEELTAQTSGFGNAELQTADATPIFAGGLNHTFEESTLGVSLFSNLTSNFSQIYAGPTWSPAPWLSLSLSAGAQSLAGEVSDRYGTSVWMGGGAFTSLTIVEGDRSGEPGLWYDHRTSLSLWRGLSAGLHTRRFVGLGPTVSFAHKESGLSVFGSWMPLGIEKPSGFDSTAGLIGLSWSTPR